MKAEAAPVRIRKRSILTSYYWVLLVSSCIPLTQGWILPLASTPFYNRGQQRIFSSSVTSSNSLGTDEAAWKKEGERIILQAAAEAGANPEMIQVEWKSGRIVVTVDGSAYIPADIDEIIMGDEADFDEEPEFSEEAMDFDEKELEMVEDDEFNEEDFMLVEDSLGVDVVSIARAVNAAFETEGEGSLGYSIAVHHSIEVTTPGANDELSGIMFEAYKGFDVILEFQDSKTGKVKKVEGKFVERDEEFTHINERGRMRKFKNELVQSVKLPKAKTEKGVSSKKGSPKKSKKRK